MTDHAATLESALSKPLGGSTDVFRREPTKIAPALAPSMTTAPKLNQIADLLLELPHEQIKHMAREVLSDLVTVSDKTVSDLIESMLSWAHREKNSA
jgi:hypothetical protein